MGTNGVVYFVNAYLGLGNVCLPGDPGYGPVRYLAVYHDDLVVQADGDIYYQTFATCPLRPGMGQCTVIQFHNIRTYGSGVDDNMDFEAILYPDGTIVYQYAATASANASRSNGGSATVGIQHSPSAPPQHALEYSCNAAVLAPGLAIAFAPPGSILGVLPRICQLHALPVLGTAGRAALVVLLLAAGVLLARRLL